MPLLVDAASLDAGDWSRLEGLTSVAALALALGTGFVLVIELAETTDSRNLDIYRDIYEKLMAEPEIAARRYIYQQLPDPGDPQTLIDAVQRDPEAQRCVKRVLNMIDYFGFLVDQEWVTADEVIGWVSPIVVKVWVKIGPLVEYECAQRPEEPDYYEAARKLAERCRRWRDAHYPQRAQAITFDRHRI